MSTRTGVASALRSGVVLLAVAAVAIAAGCGEEQPDPARDVEGSFALSSTAFEDGGPIPARYTCDGEDISPPLAWSGLPEGTASLTLVVEDPDAVEVAGEVWVHWVLYNVPVRATSMAEGVSSEKDLPGGAHSGRGSSRVGYQGPCPPQGRTHTYVFTCYAVDTFIDLPGGATRDQVREAIDGHVLAVARLTGTYQRQEE